MARGDGTTEGMEAVLRSREPAVLASQELTLPAMTQLALATEATQLPAPVGAPDAVFDGQIVTFSNGSAYLIHDGDPQLAEGLELMEDFETGPPTRVRFSDGAEVVLDPEQLTAACSCGADGGCSHRVAALATQADDTTRLRHYLETRELTELGALLREGVETEGDWEPIAAPEATLAPTRELELADRITQPTGGLSEVMRMSDDDVFGRMCSEELLEARKETAERLALEIPDESSEYVLDDRLVATASIVRDAMEIGQRSFGFFGPQGTGKNSFTNQLAATLGMPVLEIDFGAGDDMEQLLGTTGLRKVDVTETVRDAKGNPVLNEDGEPLTRVVGTATETTLEVGPVTQAACSKGGAVIVFNEIVEAPRGQLTTLHNMIGSEAGGGKRFIVLKSPSGEKVRHELDPNTMIVCTWNPDRADRRPHPALASRMRMVRFAHGTLDDEVERVAVNVHALLKDQHPEWSYDPKLTRKDGDGEPIPVPLTEQVPELKKEIEKDVKLMRTLREHYFDGTIEHCPDTRTMVNFSTTRIQEKDHPDGSSLALMQLEFMFNQSESAEETWQRLLEIASDTHEDVAVMNSGI